MAQAAQMPASAAAMVRKMSAMWPHSQAGGQMAFVAIRPTSAVTSAATVPTAWAAMARALMRHRLSGRGQDR